jgi:hypothetical protein
MGPAGGVTEDMEVLPLCFKGRRMKPGKRRQSAIPCGGAMG